MNALRDKMVDQLGFDFDILAFPTNQFGLQEPGRNDEILNTLKYVRPGRGYVPTFPLFQKGDCNGENEQPLFTYLKSCCPPASDMIINDLSSLYWKPLRAGDVRWNFEKFLVDPEGRAVMRFTAPVEPVEMEPVIEEFIPPFCVGFLLTGMDPSSAFVRSAEGGRHPASFGSRDRLSENGYQSGEENRGCETTQACLNCDGLGLSNRDFEKLEIFQHSFSRTKKDKISLVFLKRNQLTKVPWSGLVTIPSLSILYLNHNQIESFSPGTALRKLTKLTATHLSFNRIQTLGEDELRIPAQNRLLLQVYLDNNPIHCDSRVLWLANISLHERSCRCFKECRKDVTCMQDCRENCTENALNVHFHSDYISSITCVSPKHMRGKLIHEMLTPENMLTDVVTATTMFNMANISTVNQPPTKKQNAEGILPKHDHDEHGRRLIEQPPFLVGLAIAAAVLFLSMCKCARDKFAECRQVNVPRAGGPGARERQLTCSRDHAYGTARPVVAGNVQEDQSDDEMEMTPYGIAKQNPIYVTAGEQEQEEPSSPAASNTQQETD
ncbi:hypothetical protein Bbelb_353980 [Branchiostoma belcheri]|nr:hypothetical protein Bbelb_353980 [Branchiostoma belcheri]